jgi:type II secretory pathway pseudopilin PulG
MTIRKKNIIRHYTIVEVMVAMGIFLVMMTIMMQFFTSAQKVWNAASKRNMMYADARVAMNLMTRELQSMLYRNDVNDPSGSIYPFWLEWTDIDIDVSSVADEERTAALKDYFTDNNDLFKQSGGSTEPYLTALNFISATDLKPVDEGSDISEIRYRFTPVYFKGSTPYTINSVKGGKLERSCTAEYYEAGTPTEPADYNFATNPYPTTDRVKEIWKVSSETTDPAPFQTVITGVYSLRFTCYTWKIGTGLVIIDPMDEFGKEPTPNTTNTVGYDLITGTPAPVAIRIDMKLMAPKDLKKLVVAINESNTKQIKTLKQKMRTFSKVIYLGKR